MLQHSKQKYNQTKDNKIKYGIKINMRNIYNNHYNYKNNSKVKYKNKSKAKQKKKKTLRIHQSKKIGHNNFCATVMKIKNNNHNNNKVYNVHFVMHIYNALVTKTILVLFKKIKNQNNIKHTTKNVMTFFQI